MSWRKALRGIWNLFLILTISFVLGEMVLRIYNHINPSYVFYDSSYNQFRTTPHTKYHGFPINSFGFHDVDWDADKGDRFRIAAIGDSFGFGVVPYRYNYLTLTEEILDRERPPVEVLNMGIPRTGPPDYLALLMHEALDLDPDMVLLSFYIGNDFLESYRAVRREPKWHERSYVISLFRFAFLIRPESGQNVVRSHQKYRDDQPTFSRRSHIEVLGNRAKVYLVGWEGGPVALKAVIDALEEIATICRKRDIALAVVIIPEETQLDEELQQDLAATFKLYRDGTMDYLLPTRVLVAVLDDLGIDGLDLYPVFAEASATQRLYKPRDTHWNIAGNRLAAEAIARYLLDGPLSVRDTPSGSTK